MAYPIHTPQDNRIKQLQQKIHRKPGANKGLQNRLSRAKTNQYTYQQQHTPPEPTPWNAQAETTIGGLNRDYNQSMSQLEAQKASTEQDYGFAPQYSDPSTNPYSRAALLQASYERNRATTLNSYAGHGQLYAGSTQNAANYDIGQNNAQLDQLQKAYQSQLTGITGQELQAKTTLEEGTAAARAKALEDALNTPADPSESPAVPGFVKKDYMARIKAARKHGKLGKARKYRRTLAGLTNPNPLP